MKSLPLTLFILVVVGVLLGACSNQPAETGRSEDEVAVAVAATLTAVAQVGASPTTPALQPTPTSVAPGAVTPTPAMVEAEDGGDEAPDRELEQIILPPIVPDFAPSPRPANSMGNPEAPVVIYEWSDYT